MKDKIEKILNTPKNIGDNDLPLQIKNVDNYALSFKLKMFSVEDDKNNERLEFCGDKILDAIITHYIFQRFPEQQEGFLTKLKSRLVRSDSLIKFGKYLQMGFLISEVNNVSINNIPIKSYEDSMEAFIGAIIVDFGFDIGIIYARRFVINIIETQVDFGELLQFDDNYKDILNRYFHKKNFKAPVYTELQYKIIQDRRQFSFGIFLPIQQVQSLGIVIETNVQQLTNEHLNIIQVKEELSVNKKYLVGYGSALKKKIAEKLTAQNAIELIVEKDFV